MKDGKKRFLKLLAFTLASVLMLASLAGCFKKSDENSQNDDIDEEEQFEQISAVNDSITEFKESDEFLEEDIDTQTELVLKQLEEHAKEGRIKEDSINCDEDAHVITFEYCDGTLGLDLVGGFDEMKSDYGTTFGQIQRDASYPYTGDGNSADAIILNAMTDRDWANERCRDLGLDWSNYGLNTDVDETVTLDEMASLNEYEFIFVNMHGGYWYFSKLGRRVPCVFLEQKASIEINDKYRQDLHNSRVGITTDHEYYITPSFMSAHYDVGDFSNSIFYFGSCQTMGAHGDLCYDWVEVLEDLSAKAVIAYHESVYTNYVFSSVDVFMKNLLAGETVNKSIDEAENTWGHNNTEWYLLVLGEEDPSVSESAYPILSGNKDATIEWEVVSEGTTTTSPSEEPTPTPTPTPEPVIDLYAGYREILVAYEDQLREVEGGRPDYGLEESLNSCALTDLTGDGFPELIVLCCSNHLYDFRLDGFVYADVNIYTILPGETAPTLMLNIPKFVVTQGMYLSDLVVLTDGTLMLYTYSGMTSYYESYIQYKYSPDENAFIQANQLDYACVYNGETGDEEISYSYNGESISESDYYGLAESYTYMFDLVLFKNPKYENYSSLTNWENACLNAHDCSMNFDMAWDLIVPVHNIDPVLTQEQALEAFENYWAATFEWDSDSGLYQTPFGTYTNFDYSDYYSDEYTCVYRLSGYLGAQAWFYVYYFMDLTTGSVYTIKYEDTTWSAAEDPNIVMYGIEFDVFNAFDYL